jgi:hypothetical protein
MTCGELKELRAIIRDLLADFKAGNVAYDYAEARILELICEREEQATSDALHEYQSGGR